MKEVERNQVLLLITKASESQKSEDALRFSQAAVNAANALCALQEAGKPG